MDEVSITLRCPLMQEFKETMLGFGEKAVKDGGPHGVTSWRVDEVPGTRDLIVSFTMGTGNRTLRVDAEADRIELLDVAPSELVRRIKPRG